MFLSHVIVCRLPRAGVGDLGSLHFVALLCLVAISKVTLWPKVAAGAPAGIHISARRGQREGRLPVFKDTL